MATLWVTRIRTGHQLPDDITFQEIIVRQWNGDRSYVRLRERNWDIPVSLSSEEALHWVKRLIFDWETVHDMARYVYRVGKRWSKLPMYHMPGLLEGLQMRKFNTDYVYYNTF
ncbi:hypothetical protein K435DRAFT_872711 [Dendrothele bispora CBS 962.96]|uniref:Uncharacterized protein n=1 Tax=Dendrothele bispora (strain CBS 962.96) TaxID=1314807 RepID=A0A4S8L1B4_DENBC|nr:hypothetical protein K435DRAFT_872711 [Dendrothele bispora CBS 962.96]